MRSTFSHSGEDSVPTNAGTSSRRRYQNVNLILEATPGLGSLHLGDYSSAEDQAYLEQNGISCVLTLLDGELPVCPKDTVNYHKVVKADDTCGFRLKDSFVECFQFIHEHRSKGKGVLVHCMGGVSRSATIVIAYLMTIYPTMNFDNAFMHVKRKRRLVRPNDGFLEQLRQYNKEIEEKRKTEEKLISLF